MMYCRAVTGVSGLLSFLTLACDEGSPCRDCAPTGDAGAQLTVLDSGGSTERSDSTTSAQESEAPASGPSAESMDANLDASPDMVTSNHPALVTSEDPMPLAAGSSEATSAAHESSSPTTVTSDGIWSVTRTEESEASGTNTDSSDGAPGNSATTSGSTSGDTSSTDSTPGSTGSPHCVDGHNTLAMTADGLVPPACNEFEINGKWYCYDDDVNPTTCTAGEAPYDPATSAMCLSGTTMVDETFDAWGGALGFAFKLVDGSPAPWDATSHDVIGFRITISGVLNDLPLRLSFNNSTSDYWAAPQVDLPEVGTHSVLFEDALVPEWADNAGDTLDPTQLLELELHVFGGSAFADYDICITELTPIVDAS